MLFAISVSAQKTIQGRASYYGNKFHGRMTSDGSVYHRDSLTCAHRTLPFGTLLRVKNLANDREVIVKVNDRGPFVKGRILDLSYAAAKKIGMVGTGLARVEVKNLGHASKSIYNFSLPELQLPDPMTGEFYTVSEWAKRGPEARDKAEAYAAEKTRAEFLAQYRQQPRWQVCNTKTTAKADNRKARSRRM